MLHSRRQVNDPAALALAAAATIGLTALAQAALFGLERAQTASGALPIGAYALEDALTRAPSVALAEGERAVWIVSGVDCPACRTLERRAAERLGGGAYAIRLVLAAPRDAALEPAEAIGLAALARRGTGAWEDCVDDARGLAFVSDVRCQRHISSDPAEIEGYLEWGRASYDRIADVLSANGVTLEPPAVIWRDEAGWQVTMGAAAELPETPPPERTS